MNKVSTRVQLRFNINRSAILSEDEKNILRIKLNNKLTSEGDILVVCDENRSQYANLAVARHKLALLVQNALKRPKKRLKTRPTKASRLKRLDNKRKLSIKKINRRLINDL